MEATAENLKKMIAENPPRPYDLTDPAEQQRLFREVRGYLHTCHKKHGTDWEGRKHAMNALDEAMRLKLNFRF